MRFLALGFAVIWIVGFSVYLWWLSPEALRGLSPGEWGEYLSGLFGPPGFIIVAAALFQQGDDLKRQREVQAEQLKQLEKQIEAQADVAESAKLQSQASLTLAENTSRQTQLAVERLEIERVVKQATGLAMATIRYADRIRLIHSSEEDILFPLGERDRLMQDFQIGPEAVLETVRGAMQVTLGKLPDAFETLQKPDLDRAKSLLNNLRDRIALMNEAFSNAPELPEINQLRKDMQLGNTDRLVTDCLTFLEGNARVG